MSGEYKLTSVQYAFSRNISSASGGGVTVGRPDFGQVSLTKLVDGSSTSLLTAILTNPNYSRVRINSYSTDGQLVYRITLGNALLSSYSAGASEVCASGCPGISESISLYYAQYTIADYTQNPVRVVGYDTVKNTVLTTEL